MSSLEERRAERRRRRQMEEENLHSGTKSADEIHADIQERLARRRKERDERMANIASSVATVNGEDDLERRRRERREQRLRASGDTDYTSTDDYSSRRNKRGGTDDNTAEDTPTVNSEPVSSVPDTSEEDAAEERRRRQREEEEEEARRQAEREAEEERQRQAALEEERRREKEARRLAEEERQRQEEEERRRNDVANIESGSEESSEEDGYKQNTTENKLFIEEDDLVVEDVPVDKLERVRQWNEESNNLDNVKKRNSDNLWNKSQAQNNKTSEKSKSVDRSGSFKEINNNKIKDKLNKFEHLKDESDTKVVKDKTLLIPFVDKDGLKGKLRKFEKEIKQQELSTQEKQRLPSHTVRTEILTPQTHKLTEKLQQFEIAARSQSASKPPTRTIQKTEGNKDTPKRNVLDRWQSVDKHNQDTPNLTSPTERQENLNKRLSGNTEFIASRFLEKASRSIEEPKTTVVSPTQKISLKQSFDQRKTSQSSETQSDISEEITNNQSRTKITSRWPFNEAQSEVTEETPVKQSRGKVTNRWPFKGGEDTISGTPKTGQSVSRSKAVHSRESSSDYTQSHSAGSSIDGLSEHSRRSSSHNQQEEEEEEEERLRQEKEARMGAEDGQKKRGKRKGLGGLTPEKKKKLKDFIMDVEYDDDELEEKEHEMNERVQPLPDDLDYLSSAELRKLIKSLHEKLAQIHSEAYDLEFKVNKQEKEIVDLNMKISDSRGKFAKPVLRKVNKTEQKFEKMSKKAEHKEFRETLKSAHDDDAN